MAEPVAAFAPVPVIGSRFGCTKYLMPLFAPGVILKSATSSKLEYRSRVMMSPPVPASLPLPAWTVSTPSWIDQPLAGKLSDFAPRQPSVVLPSQRSFQPSCFSWSVRVFGGGSSAANSAAEPRMKNASKGSLGMFIVEEGGDTRMTQLSCADKRVQKSGLGQGACPGSKGRVYRGFPAAYTCKSARSR